MNLTPSIVREVSAMLVDMMHFLTPTTVALVCIVDQNVVVVAVVVVVNAD